MCPPIFWLFCPLASQYCINQLTGALHVIHLTRFNRRFVPCGCLLCMLSLYAERRKSQYLYYKNIAQKNAADFMQIDGMNIIYIIVYNSWTTIMPLWGSRSPVVPFSSRAMFLYAWSFYSVIHFSYSFNIHCFNGKWLWYTLKKLEYARTVLIIA